MAMPEPIREMPSRPPFDTRPKMQSPVKVEWWRVWLARVLVLTGALAIIAGVAIIFWPAALVVGGASAAAFGLLGMNVVDDSESSEDGVQGEASGG